MSVTPSGQFRFAAIAEAFSWAGLLVGMYCKYSTIGNPVGVQIMGPIHGGLFVVYLVAAFRVASARKWSLWVTVVAIAAAIPPLATWPFERWALKRGLLASTVG